jgi:superfamily I DNA and/or RNA helicase
MECPWIMWGRMIQIKQYAVKHSFYNCLCVANAFPYTNKNKINVNKLNLCCHHNVRAHKGTTENNALWKYK